MLNINNFMQNARNNLCRKQWTIFMRNRFKNCSLHMFVCSNEKKKNLLIFMFMFICWLSKKKGIRNKELELVKLEFHTEVQKRAFTTLAQVFLLNSSIKNSIYTENLSFMNSSLKKSGILLLFLQTMVCC